MSEKVLGVLNAWRTGGWRGGMHHRVLIFTENRLIVAETGDKKGTFARLMGGAFGGVVGGVGGLMYDAKRAKEAGEKLVELSVEDILKANKKNFAIDNSEVVRVELKKARLRIETSVKKQDWILEGIPGMKAKSRWKGLPFEAYVDVLKQCVPPEKLVIK